FVVLAASLALAPLAVGAQQAGKVWRIGIIGTSSPAALAAGAEPSSRTTAGLLRGLRDLGYTYGRDFVTEPRSAEGRLGRIRAIAAELARLNVDVIVAAGPALTGLKQARVTIPVVMSGSGSDPVKSGFI